MNLDDLKIYLPKFLSAESERELFEGLKNFPDNIDSRFYTSFLLQNDIIYQGDGIKNMLVVNLPDEKIQTSNCMVFSNTCDIDIENLRFFPSQIVYAPIFNLKKYRKMLIDSGTKTIEQVDAHINAIKEQKITQIFYLPKINEKIDESIVFFDRVLNIPNKVIDRKDLSEKKLFSLSNLGFYVFLLKLSIHFTRIRENIDRKGI